jgi:hypothetical protein
MRKRETKRERKRRTDRDSIGDIIWSVAPAQLSAVDAAERQATKRWRGREAERQKRLQRKKHLPREAETSAERRSHRRRARPTQARQRLAPPGPPWIGIRSGRAMPIRPEAER